MDKAVRIPSKSILFNIDQKATIISKDQIDALLSVFQSVFDESCGYYREGYIAKLERDLDEKVNLKASRKNSGNTLSKISLGKKAVNRPTSKRMQLQKPLR